MGFDGRAPDGEDANVPLLKRIAAFIALVLFAVLGGTSPAAAYLSSPVDRIYGADRHSTSALVSARYTPGVPVAYVATGASFADALSAAPAAAAQGGPLLLTTRDALPDAVRDELTRLKPQKIVVVGGTGAVSAAVYAQLTAIQPAIRRDAGTDRYATSRIVNERAFGSGAPIVYVATGRDFPDALSASAAAGALAGAVVLVDGKSTTVPQATRDLISDLAARDIRIAGGTGAVSADIAQNLASLASVIRLSGADRYETSAAISRSAFSSASSVMFAVGTSFADALSGAAYAGELGVPMLVARGDCITVSAHDLVTGWDPASRTLLGGPLVLGKGVADGMACGGMAGDGDFRVGSRVPAGTYISVGNKDVCEWARRYAFGEDPSTVITYDWGLGQRVATVVRGDYGFSSWGCNTWTPVQNARYIGATLPGAGVFVADQQFPRGTYRATIPTAEGCYWATLRSFVGGPIGGGGDNVIASDYLENSAGRVIEVTVGSDAVGFETDGCGTWIRVG